MQDVVSAGCGSGLAPDVGVWRWSTADGAGCNDCTQNAVRVDAFGVDAFSQASRIAVIGNAGVSECGRHKHLVNPGLRLQLMGPIFFKYA